MYHNNNTKLYCSSRVDCIVICNCTVLTSDEEEVKCVAFALVLAPALRRVQASPRRRTRPHWITHGHT